MKKDYLNRDRDLRKYRNRFLAISIPAIVLSGYMIYATHNLKTPERKEVVGNLAGLVIGIGAFSGMGGIICQGERQSLKKQHHS